MKKFLDFILTDVTEKKISRVILPKSSVLVPITFFQQIRFPKLGFWGRKNDLFNKEAVSTKKKQFRVVSSKKTGFLKVQSSLLCTISGGQDSILTFFLLLHIKKLECLRILYCQHLWQIKNFFSAKLIFQITYLVKVPYTLVLPQKLVNTENESREWRKKVFCRFSQLEHIRTIFTGHTQTDNFEKNLNNLFRGTSPAGLISFDFLNSPNTVGLFFPTINFTSYFFTKAEKPTKFYQIFLFQTTLKNKIINQLDTKNFVFGNKISPNIALKSEVDKPELKLYLVHNFVRFSNFKTLSLNLVQKRPKFKEEKTNNVKKKNPITKVRNQKQRFCSKQRLKFQFLNPFNRFPIVSLNLIKQEKRLINRFPLISNGFRKKLAFCQTRSKKKTTKKLESIINKLRSFSFFDSTKHSLKTQTNKNSKQQKSCSFCFSGQFLRLQVNLLKPLKDISRFSISKFFKLYNLPLLIDITNFSYRISRNKIRHQLIPFIRSLIHLNIEYLVINFLKITSQEHLDTENISQELFFIYKIITLRFLIKRTEFNLSFNFSNLRAAWFLGQRQPALNAKLLIPSLNLVQKTQFLDTNLRRTLKRRKPIGFQKNLEDHLVTMQARPNLKHWVEKYSIKALLRKNLELKARIFLQNIFFEYKNVNLSYPQIIKLHDFYCSKNKKTV